MTGFLSAAEEYHLLIEPNFMRPEISRPIAGSERTRLVPARQEGGELDYLKANDPRPDPETFARLARENAARTLKELEPTYIRDREKVIQYALLEGDSQLVAASILCPEFLEKFRDTLGPDLLVAIPNRFRVYVFPKLSSAHETMSEAILSDFRASNYPVSTELFEWKNSNLEALGIYGN